MSQGSSEASGQGIMESSSPERLPTISIDNQELYCKLVLSNLLAGSLIGKSGSTISAIRNKSGANIRISNVANLYSPDRLALISGYRDSLATAIEQVVEMGAQLNPNEVENRATAAMESNISIKLLIPKSAVSSLIGKGGQRINEMRQITGAKIHVSTKDEQPLPNSESMVRIAGNEVKSVSAASVLVVCAIQTDPLVKELHNFGPEPNHLHTSGGSHSSPMGHHHHYALHPPIASSYPGGSGQTLMRNFSMNVNPGDYCRMYGMEQWMTERNCEIFMQVNDHYVGKLVGKNGHHITEIKLQSNAKIEISKMGDFVEGTSDRLVTISGSVISVHSAHARLMRRILELQTQENPRTG